MEITQTGSCLTVNICKLLARYLGFLLFIGSLGTMIWFDSSYKITCKQKDQGIANQCSLHTKNFLKIFSSDTYLGQLKNAFVKNEGYDAHGNALYAIIIQGDNTEVNLTDGSSAGFYDKSIVADAINQYIKNSQITKFRVPYYTPLWSYLFISIFALWGIRMMFFRDLQIQFDKDSNMVLFCYGKAKTISKRIPWSEIQAVIVQKCSFCKSPAYRLALLLVNQKKIPFTFTYNGHSTQKQEDIASQINSFLKS